MVEPDAGSRIRAVARAIAVHARQANQERSARLAVAVEAAIAGELSEAERAAAIQLAHQLHGSAGTFGFPAVSSLAAELEVFFNTDLADHPERVGAARLTLDQLRAELSHEPDDADSTQDLS